MSAAAVLAAVAPGVLRLRLRTDGHALVPAGAAEIAADEAIRREFGIQDSIVVVVHTRRAGGIFNTATLTLIQNLTRALQRLDGVRGARSEPTGPVGPSRTDVFSLATERGDRVKPGTLISQPFLEPMPTTAEELARLRSDLQIIELYRGTLVSTDETAAAILVGVPSGADRVRFYRAVRDCIAAVPAGGDRIELIGPPVAEMLLGTHILQDLGVPERLLGERENHRLEGQLQHPSETPPRPSGANWKSEKLLRHVGLVPVALGVMALVFAVSFGRLAAALLPLAKVGACLVFVFGLMGWCGVPVYLTITVMPVILTVAGVAGEVHILSSFRQKLTEADGVGGATLPQTMDEIWKAVFKSMLTTAIGFLSFALSPMKPVWAFGIFTAVGMAFCLVWSLSVTPAVLTMLSPRRLFRGLEGRAAPRAAAKRGAWFERVGAAAVRRRYLVCGVVLIGSAAAWLGVRRVVVQDSWLDGFARDSPFRRAVDEFNEQFLGSHILLVRVETGESARDGEIASQAVGTQGIRLPAQAAGEPARLVGWTIQLDPVGAGETPTAARSEPPYGPGAVPGHAEWTSRIESAVKAGDEVIVTTARKDGFPGFVLRQRGAGRVRFGLAPRGLTQPDVLREIERLEAFIAHQTELTVGGVLGPADYVATTNFLLYGRRAGERRIPDDADAITRLWGHYERLRGRERLRQVVDDQFGRALITVFMRDANFVATARLMRMIRAYEQEQLVPRGMRLAFAGDVAVSQTLIDAIVTTQVRSLVISLLGVLVVTAVLGWSLSYGVLCTLPCSLAVLFSFAGLGWAGVPLGVATSMFAAMTLGIGDDYAIHLLERYRQARTRGVELEAALIQSVGEAGPAIFIDGLAVALGFGVLMLSQVPANARLGGLVVLSIGMCVAGTVLALPAVVRIVRPRALR